MCRQGDETRHAVRRPTVSTKRRSLLRLRLNEPTNLKKTESDIKRHDERKRRANAYNSPSGDSRAARAIRGGSNSAELL